jgi:membrane-associated phospholipid phosphatase
MNISSDFVNRSAQGNHRGWFASLTAPTKQGTRIILTAGIGVVVVILFGLTFAILGTVLLTAIIIFLTKSLRVGSTFAATVAATWLSLAVVKLLVHRVRPDPTLLNFPFNPAQIDASYPSGHAAFVTALVVTIVLGVAVGRRRWVTAIIGGLLIIGVGTALVINGVHYPSDVIGSIIWGITVAPLARYVWVSVVLRRLTPSNLKTQQ